MDNGPDGRPDSASGRRSTSPSTSSTLVVSRSRSPRTRSSRSVSNPSRKRLGLSIAAFEKEIKGIDERLSRRFEALHIKQMPDLTDIVRVTEEISDACVKKHGGWRQHAVRVIPFLNRICEFAPIGDVIVGGAQNLMVSGVWAAVRLALETSVSFLTFFDKVSDMLLRVSKSSDLNRDFATLFPQNDILQGLACEYLAVVVDIATKIVHYAQKSTVSQVTTSLLSSFQAKFSPLESQLRDIGLEMKAWADRLAIEQNQESHSRTHKLLSPLQRLPLMMSEEKRAAEQRVAKRRMQKAICPNQGDLNKIYRQLRAKANPQWLFSEDLFKKWSSAEESSLLWIRGCLGSGKSVLMASAVAHLARSLGNPQALLTDLMTFSPNSVSPDDYTTKDDNQKPTSPTTVSYFFCTAAKPTTTEASTIISSIVHQALESTPLSRHFANYLQSSANKTLSEGYGPSECIDILIAVTPRNWKGYFVIDGLDECSRGEIDTLFRELKRLYHSRKVLLLCSSRNLWEHFERATYLIGDAPSVTLEEADRESEVRSYISDNAQNWKAIYKLSQDSAQRLSEQLEFGWDGMFLWLALQMEAIADDLDQGVSVGDIISNLPRNLPEAYDKALLRIPDYELASRIFKLVVGAEPPLTFQELRTAANMIPGRIEWHEMDHPPQESRYLRRYGGHLLESDEDGKICFIHHSAMLHLINPPVYPKAGEMHFGLREAEQHMGSVCLTYLNLPAFNQTISAWRQPDEPSRIDVPSVVLDSVVPNSHLKKALQLTRLKSRPKDGLAFDVDQLLSKWKSKPSPPTNHVEAFLEYAKANWLTATRNLDAKDRGVIVCLDSILDGRTNVVSLQFMSDKDRNNEESLLLWSVAQSHYSLLETFYRRFQARSNQTVHMLNGPMYAYGIVGAPLIPVLLSLIETGAPTTAPYFEPLVRQIFDNNPDSIINMRAHALMLLKILMVHTDQSQYAISLIPRLSYCLPSGAWSRLEVNIPELYEARNADFQEGRHAEPSWGNDAGSILRWHLKISRPGPAMASPLQRAVLMYDVEAAEYLISQYANVNYNGHGWSPLLLATKQGHKDLVELLLKNHADVACRDSEGATPLMLAAKNGFVGCVKLLLDNNKSKSDAVANLTDKDNISAITYATKNGHAECLKALLEHGAAMDRREGVNGYSLLIMASDLGYASCVKILLDFGADHAYSDNWGWTALMHASSRGRTLCAEVLIEFGANVNEQDLKKGMTPLMLASQNGHSGSVLLLLKNDANVQLTDYEEGFDALKHACRYGNLDCVALLHAVGGADINKPDLTSQSALMVAMMCTSSKLVIYLIEKGARTSHRQKDSRTALHYGALYNKPRHIEAFLTHANPNDYSIDASDANGDTALHLSCLNRHWDCIQVLVKGGAATDLTSSEGLTCRALLEKAEGISEEGSSAWDLLPSEREKLQQILEMLS